jgi:hypothetical protein
MRRLLGWVLATVVLAAAGSASAASLEIRNAVLRVVIIPEARSDINITVIKANPRLPIRLSTDLAGGTVIDGGAWFTPFFGKPVWCEANGDVHIWGVGHVANADLPQILVRMPLDARVSAGGGVFGAISAANSLNLDASGCGDWVMGNVRDRLAVSNSGSVSVRTGMAGRMALEDSGSGRIATRGAANGLDAQVSGSGEVAVEAASGQVRIQDSGSGDITVNGGQASSLDEQVSGSGDIQFRGAAQDVRASLSGIGQVGAGVVTHSLDVDISGGGDMSVQQVSGMVRADISGSGRLHIAGGHASSIEARLSGSGDVDFGGVADTVNASASGAGDLRVARVTGPVVSSTSGAGRVIVNR